MKPMWQALVESSKRLALSAGIAILASALSAVLTRSFFERSDSSSGESDSAVINLTAMLGAHILLFIVLLVAFTSFFARRARAANATAAIEDTIASENDTEIIRGLQHAISNMKYGIAESYLFGSVIARHPTRDVDVAVRFRSSKPRIVRNYRINLYQLERQFEADHDGLKLHFALFLDDEEAALRRFLQIAGNNRRLT